MATLDNIFATDTASARGSGPSVDNIFGSDVPKEDNSLSSSISSGTGFSLADVMKKVPAPVSKPAVEAPTQGPNLLDHIASGASKLFGAILQPVGDVIQGVTKTVDSAFRDGIHPIDAVKNIFSPSVPFKAEIGQGMTPEQTQKAYDVLGKISKDTTFTSQDLKYSDAVMLQNLYVLQQYDLVHGIKPKTAISDELAKAVFEKTSAPVISTASGDLGEGGAKFNKASIKEFAKETDPAEIANTLRLVYNVPAEQAAEVAIPLARASTVDEVKSIFMNHPAPTTPNVKPQLSNFVESKIVPEEPAPITKQGIRDIAKNIQEQPKPKSNPLIRADLENISARFPKKEPPVSVGNILSTEKPAIVNKESNLSESPNNSINPLTVYRGGGEGSMPKGMTADDIISYEKNDLGNTINPVEGIDLKTIPSESLQWVTADAKSAKEYGAVKKITPGNYRVVATDTMGGQLIQKLPATDAKVGTKTGSLQENPKFNQKGREALHERPVEAERVKEYKGRLKLRGADPVLVDAIITPSGNRAYGVSVNGTLTFEKVVEHLTEDHEVFHQVFQNFPKMRLFKDFDRSILLSEAKDLYGDLPDAELEEEMAKDFQQYVNERESGKQSSFFGKIKEFFDRLWASLKRIFKDKGDIQDFYDTVYEGKASEETSIENTASESFNAQQREGVVDFRAADNVAKKFLDEVPAENAFNDTGDLTLTTLKKLQGRTTVSKQFISDLTNSGDIKQVERDLIRAVLETEGDKVNVKEFADRVKAELLPIEIGSELGDETAQYEQVSLPDDLRGNVENYKENVYTSPIKTYATDIHFPHAGVDNYFGHTRIEDMADSQGYKNGGTRRVIEVQSDLFQKGQLEREEARDAVDTKREGDVQDFSKLKQYTNPTAHFRMVREEIKEAAKDGKTALQFPTGETAMKIEGLGQSQNNFLVEDDNENYGARALTSEDLKVGNTIYQSSLEDYVGGAGDQAGWVITDVLGDGKFKAIPKNIIDGLEDELSSFGPSPDDAITALSSGNKEAKEVLSSVRENETFDISGKVDTNDPIYRFYEKDLGRYLKNNYDAKPVTDAQGVTWYEVPVRPEMATQPVPAFNEKNPKFDSGDKLKDARDALAHVEKRTGTKSVDVNQLHNMLNREEDSLAAYNKNPEAHKKAYGEDRKPKYEAKIKDLERRLFDAKTSELKTEIQETVPTEKEKAELEAKGKKYGFTIPEYTEKSPLADVADMIGLEDSLRRHPAMSFMQYVNKRTGILPEINQEFPGVYGQKMKDLLEKKGFSSVSDAQKSVDQFIAGTELLERMSEDRFNPVEMASSPTVTDTNAFELEKARLSVPGAQPFETMVNQSDTIPVKKKVGAIDYLRTPDRVLKKIGLSDESALIKQKYADYLNELPKNIDKITDWAKRTPRPGASARIFDYLDGYVGEDGFMKVEKLPLEELKVAEEIKAWLKDWAIRLGLKPHEQISNYITHIFEDDLIKKEFDQDLAKIIQGKVAGQVYDPFLEKRLGRLGYVHDAWRALDAYVKRATRKVHMDVALEKVKVAAKDLDIESYNYVNNYVDRINLRPTKADNLVDNTLKEIFGYRFGQRPLARITRAARQMVFRGTLGLNIGSAVKNLTQGVNTYAKLGEKHTLIGYSKLINGLNQQELIDEGILNSDMIQDRAISATKKFWEKTDKVLFYLFETVEKVNRGAAYFGAKAKYTAEHSKVQNGIQVWDDGFSEKGARAYGKKMVEDTQFTFGSVDTPVALQSDIARTLLQFQSFNIKQAEFLTEMAKTKNFAGLLRYVLASLVVLFTIGKMFGYKWQDMIPFSRYGLPPFIRIPLDTAKAILGAPDKFGNIPSHKSRINSVIRNVASVIPGGVQAQKTYKGLKSAFQDKQSTAQTARSAVFGQSTSKEKTDASKRVSQQRKDSLNLTTEAEKKIVELRKKTPAEAKAELGDIAVKNPDLAKKVLDLMQEDSLGLTALEKSVKQLGIANGNRAEYIYEKMKDLKTNKEKQAYLADLAGKKLVTAQVLSQILELQKSGK